MVKEILQLHLFDANYGFLPGQIVRGVILINAPNDIYTGGITVTLEGKVQVGYSEQQPSELVYHNGRLQHLNTQGARRGQNSEKLSHYPVITVVRPDKPGEDGELILKIDEGIHSYPFDYPLPTFDIPSTYSSPSGRIKYQIKAKMEIIQPTAPDPVSEYEKSVSLIIEKHLDLSERTDTATPFTFEKRISTCCKISFIKLTLNIPQQGYALGERIPFTVTIVNNSGQRLESLKLRLMETWLFIGEEGEVEWMDKLGEVTCPPISPKKTVIWRDSKISELVVPQHNQVTHFGGGCTIIDVCHYLNIVLEQTCTLASGVDEMIPILIGTIPIQKVTSPLEKDESSPQIGEVTPLPPVDSEVVMPAVTVSSTGIDKKNKRKRSHPKKKKSDTLKSKSILK